MLQKQVGITELGAWAVASKELAEKEGFKGVAASVEWWVNVIHEWNRAGAVTVELRPVFADEYKLQQKEK